MKTFLSLHPMLMSALQHPSNPVGQGHPEGRARDIPRELGCTSRQHLSSQSLAIAVQSILVLGPHLEGMTDGDFGGRRTESIGRGRRSCGWRCDENDASSHIRSWQIRDCPSRPFHQRQSHGRDNHRPWVEGLPTLSLSSSSSLLSSCPGILPLGRRQQRHPPCHRSRETETSRTPSRTWSTARS